MLRLRALPCAAFAAFIAFLTSLYGAPPAGAQSDRWTPAGGPGGGTVTELAVGVGSAGPGEVWAAALTAGLFQSTNAAASWRQPEGRIAGHQGSGLDLDPSWVKNEILTLAADPSRPGTIYASTRETVLKSTDNGATWHPIGLSGDITAIAVAPSDPETLYLSAGREIWRSEDGGATWSRPLTAASLEGINSLAVHPHEPRTLYAACFRGVFRSLDGGAHWTAGQGLEFASIFQVAIDPHRPSTIYAGGYGGFWKSLDRGVTWAPIGNLGSDDRVVALVADPATPDTLYAAAERVIETGPNGFRVYGGEVVRSTDGGATWTTLFQTDHVRDLEIDPGRPSRLYVATEGFGAWKTENGGATWTLANDGMRATQINRLAADPHNPGVLYASVGSFRTDPFDPLSLGIWKSEDGGLTWRTVNTGLEGLLVGRNLPQVRKILFHPEIPGFLYIATSAGLFKTLDGGASWQRAAAGSPVGYVYDVALDPTNPDILYMVGFENSTFQTPAAAKSLDGGATWTRLTGLSGELLSVIVHPEHPSTVFLGGRYLWRSDDADEAGETWTQLSETFDAERLALRPGSPDLLYVVLNSQLFGSADGGATVTRIDLATPEPFRNVVYDLVASPANPASLFVATNQGAFALSQPDDVWVPVGTGLPLFFLSLAVDPFSPERLYAASRDGLVYSHGRATSECLDTPAALCLQGRFRVELTWENPQGAPLAAHAQPVTSESGSFWVFDPGSAELVAKVLDGRPVNGSFWIFLATLSNLSYTVRVTDTTTGEFRLYRTDRAVSLADTGAFQGGDVGNVGSSAASPTASSQCPGTTAALCFDDRFRVDITWRNENGATGAGQAVSLGEHSGAFWFTRPQDLDAAVKVLDGRAVNGHFWVFDASLTTLSYTARVTDLETGAVKTYEKPAGALSSRIDVEAF